MCKNCERIGHIRENCYQLISSPLWFNDKSKQRSGTNFHDPSLSGGTGWGTQKFSKSLKKNRASDSVQGHHVTRFNGVSSSGFGSHSASPAMHAASSLQPADWVGINGLNDIKWKMLIVMLNDRKLAPTSRLSGKYFDESWIIDTSASNHMTWSFDFLSYICDMTHIMIKIHDGQFSRTTKQGRVLLVVPLLSWRCIFLLMVFSVISSLFSTNSR